MKLKRKYLWLFVSFFVLWSCGNAFSQENVVRKTGIGFRGSYWKMTNETNQVTVTTGLHTNSVKLGNAGGNLYLFSRFDEHMFFEITLGSIGNVEEEERFYSETDVDVFAITPLLLGIRYDLLSPETQSGIIPYVAFGGGPYWVSNIHVEERMFEDIVTVDTRLKSGGYLGTGFNFLLTDWFAVNFDVKYHFMNFNVNHEYSGVEYGLGVNFMWGKYNLH